MEIYNRIYRRRQLGTHVQNGYFQEMEKELNYIVHFIGYIFIKPTDKVNPVFLVLGMPL